MKPETTLPSPLPLVRQTDAYRKQLFQASVHLSQRTGQGEDKVAIMYTKTWRWITGRAWERKSLCIYLFLFFNKGSLLLWVKDAKYQAPCWLDMLVWYESFCLAFLYLLKNNYVGWCSLNTPAGPPLGDGGVGMAEEIWDNELRESLCDLTFLQVMLKIPKSSLKSWLRLCTC